MPRADIERSGKSSDRVGIVGQPGTGKTRCSEFLGALGPRDNWVIYDPLDEDGR